MLFDYMTAIDNKKPIVERPVDNLKFTAYKKIVDSFADAVSLIKNKKPVLGEPIVVPYYQVHDDIDETTGEYRKTIELAFGIGSADINNPYIATSTNDFIGDNILISDDDSSTGYVPLKYKLENITDDAIAGAVENLINNNDFINQLTEAIINNSQVIDDTIDAKISSRFVWRSLSELIQ